MKDSSNAGSPSTEGRHVKPTVHIRPAVPSTPSSKPGGGGHFLDDDDLSEERTKVTKIDKSKLPVPNMLNPSGFLVVLYPPTAGLGQRIEIPAGMSVVIGRSPECQFQVNDDSVSRRHAQVINEGKGIFFVKDLGSTNGTHINDRPISTARTLTNGDRLRVGTVLLKFLSGNDIEADYHKDVYKLTISDALTETYNKRYLLENLEREIEKARRNQRPLSFVMIDIDKFKLLNDTYGHLVGDLVLREVARRIASTVRKSEIFARYGGEEFSVLLPETPLSGAVDFAQRARSIVASQPFEAEGNRIPVTISLGVAEYKEPFPEIRVEDLIAMADEKLYEAKSAGRNCVRF